MHGANFLLDGLLLHDLNRFLHASFGQELQANLLFTSELELFHRHSHAVQLAEVEVGEEGMSLQVLD